MKVRGQDSIKYFTTRKICKQLFYNRVDFKTAFFTIG